MTDPVTDSVSVTDPDPVTDPVSVTDPVAVTDPGSDPVSVTGSESVSFVLGRSLWLLLERLAKERSWMVGFRDGVGIPWRCRIP